jgi:hypothetical protein
MDLSEIRFESMKYFTGELLQEESGVELTSSLRRETVFKRWYG